MNIQIFSDADEVAAEAAKLIAMIARQSVEERGRFILAVSGGRTPWQMLRALGKEDVPWKSVHVFQVDERIAPTGHPDRNLTQLRHSLLENSPINEHHIYAMPVEWNDLEFAAGEYSDLLSQQAGAPPIIDLVHLGLGADGHTASLIPEDHVLEINDRDVAVTGIYQGRNRMTLTYPIINRARNIMWVITGDEKAPMLKRLLDADTSIPAGRIHQEKAFVLADQDAIGTDYEN
jgi:6-phosphogluconolactonase